MSDELQKKSCATHSFRDNLLWLRGLLLDGASEEDRKRWCADEIERLHAECNRQKELAASWKKSSDEHEEALEQEIVKLAEARSRLEKLADALESGSVKAAVWRVIEIIDGREEWDPKVHGTGPLTGDY